ncbi:yecA family protein [Psychromonas sp. CNPT3]|uniref:UPF0149 family protein n=1 Tax=Psychromonas sp. CNPT3 TaxID=314282 RepID=UPI00006E8082|nr:UPF0149 family protein [Psychromonas sp. CNPT3]AGH80785.1 yecA family protein [Psychromonas sp. CNPT3]
MHTQYQKLQQLYRHEEIQSLCVDKDFMFAFIIAMASSKDEIELQQWINMLRKDQCDPVFSTTELATQFAQVILAIFSCAQGCFQNNTPLALNSECWLDDKQQLRPIASAFALGYIDALEFINTLCDDATTNETTANLQQTCFLLLSKLAYPDTLDVALRTLFLDLPEYDEILRCLPTLLTTYGFQCHYE